MKDDRTITQILFSRKRPVDVFPGLCGNETLPYPARRNKGTARLSAMLCKAVVVALKGDVPSLDVLKTPGVVRIKSRSQTHRGLITSAFWTKEAMWLPFGEVTYHLGLLMIAEALARKNEAADLLDAWDEVLEYREKKKPLNGDRRYIELVGHVSDELWYWAAYADQAPSSPNRLDTLKIEPAENLSTYAVESPLDANVLIQRQALKEFRKQKPSAPTVAPKAATIPNTRFRGWQLPELIEDLKLGFHCLLVGPTATGKSLSAMEAFEHADAKRARFVIEGHESMKEFDLLGSYVPEGKSKFLWWDGQLVAAMRAGGFLFIDEANRMPTRTLNVLLGVLSRSAVVLTEHGSEEVTAQPGFQVVMAMNLGRGYAVNPLDDALLSRFPITIEYRYLPLAEEIELLKALSGIDRALAEPMVKIAHETRAKKKSHELSGEITPRALLAWAAKIKPRNGDIAQRLKQAARVTWMHAVAGIDADGYLREDVVAELEELIQSHAPRGEA